MKSTKTTETIKIESLCKHCGMEVKLQHCQEKAIDRNGVVVGVCHAGHCAHQWRLHIIGAGGFLGI